MATAPPGCPVHETFDPLIGNCVRRLLEAPERWARLVAALWVQ